jgi:hypothetical protein
VGRLQARHAQDVPTQLTDEAALLGDLDEVTGEPKRSVAWIQRTSASACTTRRVDASTIG